MKPPPEGPQLILVAGPYRSGTGDVPERIAANLRFMNEVALQVYERGHVPVTGEALALPLAEVAGSRRIGDEVFNRYFHPSAVRLLAKCDACLRVGGPSAGADEMVRQARAMGKRTYSSVDEISPFRTDSPPSEGS